MKQRCYECGKPARTTAVIVTRQDGHVGRVCFACWVRLDYAGFYSVEQAERKWPAANFLDLANQKAMSENQWEVGT